MWESVVAKGMAVGISGPLVSMGAYGAWKAWEGRGDDDDDGGGRVSDVAEMVGKIWVCVVPLTLPVSVLLILCGQPEALFDHALSAALSSLFLGWGVSLALQSVVLEHGKDAHLGGGMRVLLGMLIALWLGYGALMGFITGAIDSLYTVSDLGDSVLIAACVGGGLILLAGVACQGLGRNRVGTPLMLGGAEVASVAAALLAFQRILLGSPRLQDDDFVQIRYSDIRLPPPTRAWMALGIVNALIRAGVAWWVGGKPRVWAATSRRLLDLFVDTGTLMMPVGMASTLWVMLRCSDCAPPRPGLATGNLAGILNGDPTAKPYVFLLGACGLLLALSTACRVYAQRSIVIHAVVTGFQFSLLAGITLPLENLIGEIVGDSRVPYSNMAPLVAVKGTTIHAFRDWIWVVPFVWGAGYAWGVCVDQGKKV